MPERVHQRFDGSAPSQLTGDTSSNGRKRKREHVQGIRSEMHAKSQEPSRTINPNDHDQHQQRSDPDALQPAVATSARSRSRSEAIIQPTNESQRLKDRAKDLEPLRKSLPIWSHVSEIREALLGKNVVILVGETGSGKSTQVPQMLVNEAWCKPQSVTVPRDALDSRYPPASVISPGDRSLQTARIGGCIAITEPRRVAATTLARRVAEEMGTPLGSFSPKSTVGYSVRFDQSTSPNTRIKFLTEGTLLQEMLRDPWLKAYSAVFVDEVHERGANVDLLLGFLRNMVAGKNEGRGGIPLKVRQFLDCVLLNEMKRVTSQVMLLIVIRDSRLPAIRRFTFSSMCGELFTIWTSCNMDDLPPACFH